MKDLLYGIFVIGLLSAILLVGVLRVSRSLSRRTSNLLAILVVALMLVDALFVRDSILLTRLLPLSNLIVLGNGAPLLGSALAGLLWHRIPGPTFHRAVVIGALVAACLVAVYHPILCDTPKLADRWDRGVCLQTSPSSCSAAAAATFLTRYGIKTTEREMAMLCLTSDKGTSMHGLWRGLRLKTAGKGYDVYMFSNGTIDDLRGIGPVILSVELKADAKVDPRYQRAWGWIPGVPHTVVVLDFPLPGQVRIADPATGRETWSVEDLRVLWHGVGARFIPTEKP
jgi:hypothetical protein